MNVTPETRLRVVIVNFNGGDLLRRAVDSVVTSDWPGPVDIVVVDNASTDESLAQLEGVDELTIIRRDENEGFGANNHGFADVIGASPVTDLPATELVALLNPDAMIGPNAFRELANALEPSERIGAAAPKIIFDRPYVQLDVYSGDLTISDVRVGDQVVTSQCHPVGGAFRLPGTRGPLWRCPSRSALRVPTRRFGDSVELEFARGSSGVMSGNRVNGACTVTISSTVLQTMTVVQNAGSELDRRHNGCNRGFGDVDGTEVYSSRAPSWCGAAVMFHADYLRDVGGFEPSFFLYYEDIDLALRGIAKGWSTVYVPSAVVEHRHSDRARQGTELVEVLQHRNRLVMLMRNAPLRLAVVGLVRGVLTPASLLMTAVRQPRLAGAHIRLAKWRLRSISGAIRLAPAALASRRTIGKGRRLSARKVIKRGSGRIR